MRVRVRARADVRGRRGLAGEVIVLALWDDAGDDSRRGDDSGRGAPRLVEFARVVEALVEDVELAAEARVGADDLAPGDDVRERVGGVHPALGDEVRADGGGGA